MHFPTNQDVENLMKKEEEKKNLENKPKFMQFHLNYTLPEEERIKEVSDDIAIEYPELPLGLRTKIASTEEPIRCCHEDYDMFYQDELRIYRLFNILQVIHPYLDGSCSIQYAGYSSAYFCQLFAKAYNDIKEAYKVFLKDFTYANPGEQKVSKIMQLIKDFYDDDEIIIPES